MPKNRASLFLVVLWTFLSVILFWETCCTGKTCCKSDICSSSTEEKVVVDAAAQNYARLVAVEPGLVGYWQLDGNLKGSKGELNGQSQGGEPHFSDRPGGRALLLENGRFVTFGETPKLDLNETTVELLFKPDFPQNPGYHPCLIAKRANGDHTQTRFSIHVLGDYSGLIIWNGKQAVSFFVEEGGLQKGAWYHLAVTYKGNEVVVYLNGVRCRAESPQFSFNVEEKNRPLSVGSSTPHGQEYFTGELAELAIYDRALTAGEIARHVDTFGWKERHIHLALVTGEREQREKLAREQAETKRNERRDQLFNDPALFARGEPCVYGGEHLQAISLPVGGIGAGLIQINGKGERSIWQIFNNFTQVTVPNSFFAVRVKTDAAVPVVKALQTSSVGPFEGMKSLTFKGAYPYGWYDFEDKTVPVKIGMEVYSPLIPLDAKDSAIPCAIFTFSVENPTGEPVEVSLLAAQQNAVGYDGSGPINGKAFAGYGGNINSIVDSPVNTALSMTSSNAKGDMTLMALGREISGTASWDDIESLKTDFSANGRLSGPGKCPPSSGGQTVNGALTVPLKLNPGEKRSVTFILTWYFPGGKNGMNDWTGQGSMYENWWTSAANVADDVASRITDLSAKTKMYHKVFYSTNLPYWMLDRVSSQVAILRSKTCYWDKSGYFGAWEGCGGSGGCCLGNCSHVWHYAQAHARLFPEIGRNMRRSELGYQRPNGGIPHRQIKEAEVAADGHLGAILGAYREHLTSPDRRWLDGEWPRVKKAMDYSISTWDHDEDGALAGAQANTLDCELGGSTTWIGSLYLAALAASEKMALLENDPVAAARYRKIRLAGSSKQDETLFNGEYYIQIPDSEPRRDYLTGCHVDQLLGQWWANQLDLGELYPNRHVRSAMESLFRYSFRGSMAGIVQVPRKFVADEDAAMQMITWPKGGRPVAEHTIIYADEVMTGFEYAAAALMIQSGLLQEGFTVAKAISDRYDGRLRRGLTTGDAASWDYSGNPFGDDECGKFYGRAMSSWSLLTACQGFIYDGPAVVIGFKPKWRPADHASFFTAAEGWGLFEQRRSTNNQTDRIRVACGKLQVRTLVFEVPDGVQAQGVQVDLDGRVLPSKFAQNGSEIRITLAKPTTVEAEKVLSIDIKLGRK